MQHEQEPAETIAAQDLVLAPGAAPELEALLDAAGAPALLFSVERLDDGRLVLQGLPGIDPAIVARIRRMLAQHADVLRRLT